MSAKTTAQQRKGPSRCLLRLGAATACAGALIDRKFGAWSAPPLEPFDHELGLSLSDWATRQDRAHRLDGPLVHDVRVVALDQRRDPNASIRLRDGFPFPVLFAGFQDEVHRLALLGGQAFDAEPNMVGAVLHVGAPLTWQVYRGKRDLESGTPVGAALESGSEGGRCWVSSWK